MRNRVGKVTLVEVLVVIAIFGVLTALGIKAFNGNSAWFPTNKRTIVAKVVRKYEFHTASSTDFRVDLQLVDGSIEVMTVNNNAFAGLYDADTTYASMVQDKWYSVECIGEHNAVMRVFPNVCAVSPTFDPTK